MTLWVSDKQRLLSIADLILAEQQTWAQGWGVHDGKQWVVPDNCPEEWVKVRCFKLASAASFLRHFVSKHTPVEDYQI